MLKKELDKKMHLQKHLFEKGFLITNAKIGNTEEFPFYNNFKKTTIDSFDFWIHNRNKLHIYRSTDGLTFFVIGHFYNPFTMEYDESQILETLSRAYKVGNYFDKLSEITGVFITGIVCKDKIDVQLDASGMQYSCYAKIENNIFIASHMQLLGDVCNLSVDPYVNRLIRYRWYKYMMGNYLPGNITCFKQAKRILPNTSLEYNGHDFSINRFYPNKNIDICKNDGEYQAVINEAAEILQNTMKLIPCKWERASISLTGGLDSNTTFAATANLYDKYKTFSYIAMDRERIDADAAQRISATFGVQHKTYTVPNDNSSFNDFEVYKAIFEHNDGNIGNDKDAEVRKKIYLIQNDVCDVEVKSWVSETIRAYAYKYFGKKKFPKSLKPRNYTSLYKIFLANRKLVWDTDKIYQQYLEETHLKEHLYNYDETDFFVWEHMHGGKCGLNIGVMKSCFDITIPYNNRKLLDLLLRVPINYRISDQLHMDLKRHMNKKLYDMNIKVQNANQSSKRAKVLGIYYSINSFLPF